MVELSEHEARVLGVLVEKAHTTPSQYPMTLNAIVNACNQKSNRHPVMSLSEDQVLSALDGLRGRQLSREVMLSGSRVPKYRHTAREALEVETSELVVLAELLLRGPQTLGELRGRASRMHTLESLEIVRHVLEHLMERAQPLVRGLGPVPGSRAERFAQLLCPVTHEEATDMATASAPAPGPAMDHEARIERLERDIAEIRQLLQSLRAGQATGPVHADD
ncbi:MAG: YceH family protein [Planctomycetota bacterium]|jgi:uncharacterized protein YceH (UPF0502 family)